VYGNLIVMCAFIVGLQASLARGGPPIPVPTTAPSLAELIGSYNLDDAHLLEPFWRTKQMTGETVLFVRDNETDTPIGTLLFKPGKILRVRNARTGDLYELGRDFEIDAAHRRLLLTKDSRIPFLKQSDFYKPKGEKHAIKDKVGDPDVWLLWSESGFQEMQVAVDYERDEDWTGYVPQFAGKILPRVIEKLLKKEHVQITAVGDSIAAGGNASWKKLPPHQPSFPVLVAGELARVYGAKIDLANFAVGGSMANGAMSKMEQVLATKPDLVVIAYGMNDVSTKHADKYSDYIKRIIESVRVGAPDAEFLLVASSRANPQWSHTPVDQFPKYRDALAALCTEHIAMVDVTALWTEMLERKRYHDLTGNGVNHPNDFGHRLYAQAILAMLVNEEHAPKR
jgi:lysophospholipase L1-like esterase